VALLEIENLRVVYRSGGREVVVDGVSLTVEKGEYLALVGDGLRQIYDRESDLGILRKGAGGRRLRALRAELIGLPLAELRRIRWRDIALVPQNAMNGSDPVYNAYQLDEATRAQTTDGSASASASRKKHMVGLPIERAQISASIQRRMRQRA
jgi:peptide/nickel transport system ATP-binding protein